MLFLPLAAVAGLVVPAVDAAPRGMGTKQFDTRAALARHLQDHDSGLYREKRTPHHNLPAAPGGPPTANINGTTVDREPLGAPAPRQLYVTDADECPTAGEVITSTVTVDVTVYATAPAATDPATGEPCEGEDAAGADGDSATDPADGEDATVDTDGDGVPDAAPEDVDGDGVDELVPADEDGTDAADEDALMPKPGDKDGDGVPDEEDPCENDPSVPGTDGAAGEDATGANGDSATDPTTGANGDDATVDTDGDGIPDATPEDVDGDGVDELVPADDATGTAGDDGTAGKPTPGDKDGDGVPNAEDPCPEDASVPNPDAAGTDSATDPTTDGAGANGANGDEATVDTDGDGTPDAVPEDVDGDGVDEIVPADEASGSNGNAGTDASGANGNNGANGSSDGTPTPGDKDGDGVPNAEDPCPEDASVPNPDGAGNGAGTDTATDPTTAGNGSNGSNGANGEDATVDTDGDGTPDAVPEDVDGDGVDEIVPAAEATPGAGSGTTDPSTPGKNPDGSVTKPDGSVDPKPKPNDKDGDGVEDSEDPCPEDPAVPGTDGTTTPDGKPGVDTDGDGESELVPEDIDGDGADELVPEAEATPGAGGNGSTTPGGNGSNTPAAEATPGANAGTTDPSTPGKNPDGSVTKPDGSVDPKPKPNDKDGDGVTDAEDPCPEDPAVPGTDGTTTPDGTPGVDTDGDGESELVPEDVDGDGADELVPEAEATPGAGGNGSNTPAAEATPGANAGTTDPSTPGKNPDGSVTKPDGSVEKPDGSVDPKPKPGDNDGDGVPNAEDPCPEDPAVPGTDGTTTPDGTPGVDTDMDGESELVPEDVNGDGADELVPAEDAENTPGTGTTPGSDGNAVDPEDCETDVPGAADPAATDPAAADPAATDGFVTKTNAPAEAMPMVTEDCEEEEVAQEQPPAMAQPTMAAEEEESSGGGLLGGLLGGDGGLLGGEGGLLGGNGLLGGLLGKREAKHEDAPAVTTIPIIDNTKYRPTTTDPVIIDTHMTPYLTPTTECDIDSPAVPTATKCVHDVEDGKTDEDVSYCGVNGKPVGTYFLAEFVEQRSGEPITEEGCFQFCDSVMEATAGCQSYRFYHNDAGAPRCALYGSSVTKALFNLDADKEDTWWDLNCGSPSAENWHKYMPGHN